MKVRKRVTRHLVALGALVLLVGGCTSAAEVANNEEAYSTTYVDGVRCIVFKPSASSYDGTQMDCDFYGEGDE